MKYVDVPDRNTFLGYLLVNSFHIPIEKEINLQETRMQGTSNTVIASSYAFTRNIAPPLLRYVVCFDALVADTV